MPQLTQEGAVLCPQATQGQVAAASLLPTELLLAPLPLALQDSGTSRLLNLPYLEPLAGTLDGWLLDQWCAAGCPGSGMHCVPSWLRGELCALLYAGLQLPAMSGQVAGPGCELCSIQTLQLSWAPRACLLCRYNASSRYYDAFFLQSLPANTSELYSERLPASSSSKSSSMAAATDSRAVQRGAAAGWGGALPLKLAQAAPPQLQPGWPPSGAAAGAGVQYSVLANQTAIHGLPAAISQVGQAVVEY